MGIITVPAGGGGTFIGGYLVKKWNLSYVGIVKLCLAVTTMAVFLTSSLLLKCPNLNFAGITAPYGGVGMEIPSTALPLDTANPLESTCNRDCGCSKFYNPVCGINNVLYYNPCFAGCKYEQAEGNSKIYVDCSCITVNRTVGEELPHYDAINTMCDNTCSNLYLFTALCFLLMFFTFLGTMPALAATLRCVHEEEKSLALGIQWLKVRVLGTIPAPLIFAKLIDEACIYFKHTDGEEGTGSCLVYNKMDMSK
jgi:organic anion transporter 4A